MVMNFKFPNSTKVNEGWQCSGRVILELQSEVHSCTGLWRARMGSNGYEAITSHRSPLIQVESRGDFTLPLVFEPSAQLNVKI